MNAVLGPIVAVVVGGIIAGLGSWGLVASQTATPEPPNAPFVVYGTR